MVAAIELTDAAAIPEITGGVSVGVEIEVEAEIETEGVGDDGTSCACARKNCETKRIAPPVKKKALPELNLCMDYLSYNSIRPSSRTSHRVVPRE
jgi:hypothetical protein